MAKLMLARCAAIFAMSVAAVRVVGVASGQQDVAVDERPVLELTTEDGSQAVAIGPVGAATLKLLLGDDSAQAIAEGPQSDYWLGVQVAALPEVVKKQLVLEDGLAVEEVTPDSPAAKAEIKKHDILVKAGDAPLKNIADLVKAVDASQGKEITIAIVRDGKNQTIKVIADKRPKTDGAADAVKKALQARNPELAGEMKQLEEALEKLKSKLGKEGAGFWFAKPAVVSPRIDVRLSDKISEAVAKSWKADFPKNLSVQINKEGNQPAKIHVKRGDKEEWNVTDDKLKDLPDDILPHVERLMGKIRAPGMAATTSRVVRVSPEGKVEGEVQIAPLPPKSPPPPKAPTGPQASTPPKPPMAQGDRAMTVRAHRSEGDVDSKLDAIIKKLDERTETIEKLDKKVEGLRHEIDQLRKK